MPEEEKPYRLYKGGRVKGKVPAPARPDKAKGPRADGNGRRDYKGPRATRPRRKRRWGRWAALVLGLVVLFLLVWGVVGFLSFQSGVSSASKRLPKAIDRQLADQGGLLISKPTTILLLGTDHSQHASRAADRHSDSIMLVRTDPDHHRLTYLSIPRDLWVPIPGHGQAKINAAFQIGGPPLAVQTIRAFTGLPINHVAIVDFADFKDVIDKLGGVTVNNKTPILSNRFDCPFKTEAQCQEWQGWRFPKGNVKLDGQRALIYSRVRENRLDPGESDLTRGERQQEVLQAVSSKLASFGTFFKLPFVGGDLLKPLATDLSAWQLVQLGWVKFRAGKVIHCRLGGDPDYQGGQAVIVPNEDNARVISMFKGTSAPQPPPPGSGSYGAGCVTGNQKLGKR